jgi:hypothetical protein
MTKGKFAVYAEGMDEKAADIIQARLDAWAGEGVFCVLPIPLDTYLHIELLEEVREPKFGPVSELRADDEVVEQILNTAGATIYMSSETHAKQVHLTPKVLPGLIRLEWRQRLPKVETDL